MRKPGNEGYSLVEILVAIALIAIITIPTYTCLTLSVKINAASDQKLKEQLAVSSAVEFLMANGYSSANEAYVEGSGITVEPAGDGEYEISCGEVSVKVYIPGETTEPTAEPTETGVGGT